VLPSFCDAIMQHFVYAKVSLLLSSFDELVKKTDRLSVRVDSLEQAKATQSTQLDNCLWSVAALL